MFERNAMILCGTSGVYRVDDIGPLTHIKGYDPDKFYYKLVSIRNASVSYVPVGGSVYMRPVLSGEEASSLLEEAEQILPEIYKASGPYDLKLYCKAVLEDHDCRRLIAVLKGINVKIRTGYYKSRKIGGAEFDFKKKAELLVTEELSASLGIVIDEARERLKKVVR